MCGLQEFPLRFSRCEAVLHRPSHWERFWLRNTLLCVAGACSARVLYSMWRNGQLKSLTLGWWEWLQSKVKTHIVEPVSDLCRELFDSISKREYVVTREELEESRRALHRMLDDFSKSKRGSELILPDMKRRLQEGLFRSAPDGSGLSAAAHWGRSSSLVSAKDAAVGMYTSGKASIGESISTALDGFGYAGPTLQNDRAEVGSKPTSGARFGGSYLPSSVTAADIAGVQRNPAASAASTPSHRREGNIIDRLLLSVWFENNIFRFTFCMLMPRPMIFLGASLIYSRSSKWSVSTVHQCW